MSAPADRRWLEVGVRSAASVDAGALIADALIALGGRAVMELDGWQVTHFVEPEDAEAFRASLVERVTEMTGLTDLALRFRWQPHEDWAESWKRGLAPRRITDRLVVRPSWTEFDARPGDIVIVLDPGMAFGTAEHGTTRGCLRLLDAVVAAGDTVLDVGAGSGILSVAAAKLGASSVLAVEGDELACEALVENLETNAVAERVGLTCAWMDAEAIGGLGPFDGVVANIETGKLLPLVAGLVAALRPGGWLVLSGMLAHEWDGMSAGVEGRGLRRIAVDEDGEWRAGAWRAPA